tara:strand:+ start:2236 stop:2466 length:231 start_codon:yes stop_codon:yes gene_type:complete
MTKKILKGKVIKDQNNKTVVVLVKRKYAHPFFDKVITSSKKYHAHDEDNKFKIGDSVKIIESKPFSKKKKWEVINK